MSAVLDLLGLEWLWKRLLRPWDVPLEHQAKALEVAGEIARTCRETDEALSTGGRLEAATAVWPGVDVVRQWVTVLQDADDARVLPFGWARNRLRLAAALAPLVGGQLEQYALFEGPGDARPAHLQAALQWTALSQSVDADRFKNSKQVLAAIEQQEQQRALLASPADLASDFREWPELSPEVRASLRVSARQALTSLGLVAEKLRRDLIRAHRWRPER